MENSVHFGPLRITIYKITLPLTLSSKLLALGSKSDDPKVNWPWAKPGAQLVFSSIGPCLAAIRVPCGNGGRNGDCPVTQIKNVHMPVMPRWSVWKTNEVGCVIFHQKAKLTMGTGQQRFPICILPGSLASFCSTSVLMVQEEHSRAKVATTRRANFIFWDFQIRVEGFFCVQS